MEHTSLGDAFHGLCDIAEYRVKEVRRVSNGSLMENPCNWTIECIAAESMYSISRTILFDSREDNPHTEMRLFEQISHIIANILAGFLTNLPNLIT